MVRVFRSVGTLAAAAVVVAAVHGPAKSQDIKFFRIGTGSISGVYFPVGGLIASALSHPPGESLCGQGGSCGVPGLVAVAQASRGSVSNIQHLHAGRIESALVQADVAYLAANGKGSFAGNKAVPELKAIANLYVEALHIVVRRDSPIRSLNGLRGRRVSLDLKGSGTRSIAREVLKRYGLKTKALRYRNSQVGPAVDRLKSGTIDAFFFVGGYPAPSIAMLSGEVPLRLLPIAGGKAEEIAKTHPFLTPVTIPASAYDGETATPTLGVGALFVVSETVSEDLVYGVTRALWHPTTRAILDQGPAATGQMRIGNALKGLTIPLHKGAARYYREFGILGKPKHDSKRKPGAEQTAPVAKDGKSGTESGR